MKQDYIELMQNAPEIFGGGSGSGEILIITDPQEILETEKELGREVGIVYEDAYIRLLRDAVIFPNHKKGTYIRILSKNSASAAAVLPVSDGKVFLLRHFRHSLRKWVWEIPRGFGESGLTAAENAGKELWEETGISQAKMQEIGRVCPDSGISGDLISVYLAEISPEENFEVKDEEEAISGWKVFTQEELRELIKNGELTDGFTLSALSLAWLSGKYIFK